MSVTLEIRTGPRAGTSVRLEPGQVAQVGRSGWADLSVPGDPDLADLHFNLEVDRAGACRVRDLHSPGGTTLNGDRVTVAPARDGDAIVAGQTTFIVRLGDASTPPSPAVVENEVIREGAGEPNEPTTEPGGGSGAALLEVLGREPGPLFALLDAARDQMVLPVLMRAEERYQSLYEGDKGEEIAAYGPYLVALPTGSPLRKTLARDAWGESWGVYLTSSRPFEEVRKHFRHFLMVRTEDGKSLYFRFYDPRVLRIFLPTCDAGELRQFFGPVDSYLMEGESPGALLRFQAGPRGLERAEVPLEGEARG